MASSEEYTYTVNPPAFAGCAWIQPRISVAPSASFGFDAAGNVFNDPGNAAGYRFNCNGWTFAGFSQYGGWLDPSGAIRLLSCEHACSIACAAPE